MKSLENMQYSLLGLGDDSYAQYQGNPIFCNDGLVKLSAKAYYPFTKANENDGFRETVVAWKDAVVKTVLEILEGRFEQSHKHHCTILYGS